MNYENQGRAARALSQVGSGTIGGSDAPQSTLAQRLESANNLLYSQMDRVQGFLARVNATPQTPAAGESAKSAAVAPLSESVSNTEALAKRLCDLVDGLERIG